MSDWKQHDGSNCPVDCRDIVDIKLRDNDYYYDCTAEDWQWKSDGTGYRGDILFWRLSEKVANIPVEELSEAPLQIVDKPIVSDGSSSSYYTFDITNKAGQTITVEVGDVCRAMVANDFDLSNIIKAARRLSEASQGRGKSGASVEYDCNKVVYFANEFKHWHKEKA
jgi:hypothetical protein